MVRHKAHGAPHELIAVEPATPVRRALDLVTRHNVSQLPVLAGGECVGHVAEATLMARVLESPTLLDREVQELMDAPLPVVDAHVDFEALKQLLTRKNPAVLLRDEAGVLAGILTRYDVLRHLTGG
jgi:cystathionine beta-synthase